MQAAGQKIKSFEEWKVEMLRLAEIAVSEGRLINAAFYYRASEFFMTREDPDKDLLYHKFIDCFYSVIQGDEISKYEVPFNNTFLPAIRLQPVTEGKKGTVVLHGGFDSFIEELYSIIRYFSDHGYQVIAFDGPGQGAARKKYGLAFDVLLELNAENLHSDFVRQDVLILTGRNDHMVPFKMHNLQEKALTTARSVTASVFTKEENAQNHCQIRNIGLKLDIVMQWIEKYT